MMLAAQGPIVTMPVVVTLVSACLINCTKQKTHKIISEISLLAAEGHLTGRGSRGPLARDVHRQCLTLFVQEARAILGAMITNSHRPQSVLLPRSIRVAWQTALSTRYASNRGLRS